MKTIELDKKFDFLFEKEHPWIYRNKFNQFEKELKNGDIVKIISSDSKKSYTGIYAEKGLVAIRIFLFSKTDSIKSNLIDKVHLRRKLFSETNSLRLIHGENDLFPGITVDIHDKHLVIMNYHSSLEKISRWISKFIYSFLKKNFQINLESISIHSPNRIGFESIKKNNRVLKGSITGLIQIQFKKIKYQIDLESQKSGIYNDIRNLRRYIFENKKVFQNKKVLNLFSSNGFLSKILRLQDVSKLVSVEDSNNMIFIHEKNENINHILLYEHKLNSTDKNILIKEDILKNKETLFSKLENFDTIIIDPPNLTNNEKDISKAKNIYKSLIILSLQKLNKNGNLILASCSNRIHPNEFYRICKETVSENFEFDTWKKLDLEPDHPINPFFPEGNYFKVNLFLGVKKS